MELNINDDDVIENLTEDELRSEITNLGEEEFLILSSRSDDDEYYIQAYHNEDDTWQLEYRDGSVDRHFGVDPATITVADVTEAMVLYFNDPGSIAAKWNWEQIEFDDDEVEYHGVMMSPDWPEKIETAQLIETITIDGKKYERIRYCHETHVPTNRENICRDCGVLPDQFHVPGCDGEQCPCCKRQLLSCDCEVEEECDTDSDSTPARRDNIGEMPEWDMPENLDELLAEEEGMWEDDRWEPILLIVMTGTVYKGREIPRSWQIEFEPFDAGDEANLRLKAQGYERDGYSWGEAIYDRMNAAHPELADQLHLEDCEVSTCVIWVESEETCRVLMEETWKLMFGE